MGCVENSCCLAHFVRELMLARFFPTTEQHLIAERDRLNKDLEQAHSYVLLSLSLSLSYPEFLLGFRSTYSQIYQITRIGTRSNWWSNRIRFDRFP